MYTLIILLLAIFPSNFAEDNCISTCWSLSDSRSGTCWDRNWDTAKNCRIERPRLKDFWMGNLYFYVSKGGSACNGRCGKYNTYYEWCYKINLGWDYCYTDKIYEKDFYTGLKSRINEFKSNYSSARICFNEFEEINPMIEVSATAIVTNQTVSSSVKTKVLDHPYPLSLIIAYIKNEEYSINYMEFNDENNPLKGVSTAVIPGVDERPELQLTISLEAVIYKRHLLNSDCKDVPKNRTQLLDIQADDDIGFLLAPTLGGPRDWYNVVPMYSVFSIKYNGVSNNPSNFNAEDCNYGINNLYLLDQALRLFFIEQPNGYVEWKMVVNYGKLPQSPRPTDFLVDVTLRDSKGYPVNRNDGVFQKKSNIVMIIPNGPK